ncbi:hypothetical protein SAY87_003676 [Trapa incisa]|uniref:Pentatricopeptide repeat-containing protein n=2 Tax=Trapa TaxID=22665 RepID=A0AAN7QW39_TRANT|nr:hypothetical protein SAY87_003676 [Trapa incisa]KAK4778966.1 hypothetical protein SAY86_006494 [Trapa natans]
MTERCSMNCNPRWKNLSVHAMGTQNCFILCGRFYCSFSDSSLLQELCSLLSTSIGGLDELESNLNRYKDSLSPQLVSQMMDICKDNGTPSRRLLRFFSWSRKNLALTLSDADFNSAIRVFSKKMDHTAVELLISDIRKEGRSLDRQTYGIVAETLVKLRREDEALGIFKNLEKFNCPQDEVTVTAIVSALCSKGHAKKAEGVVWHHKDKIEGIKPLIYRSLLYGWSGAENVKEARRIIKEMRSMGIMPDLFCFNMFLRCLCKQNLKKNPSGLLPEALNVMMEMRTYNIAPNSISYNIVLSCLGRTRRVKEVFRLFSIMKSACALDWVSYYLTVRVLYLSGRFGKGNLLVDEMIEKGYVPGRKFYYDLIGILCGVERVNHAIDLFERMKMGELGGYGPVYDVLIPKLCRSGDFEKGRELWEEAEQGGVQLSCSQHLLDPSITEVFIPVRKVEKEEIKLLELKEDKSQLKCVRAKQKRKRSNKHRR